jgi:hypothetical protein
MSIFTAEQREQIRKQLVAAAQDDPRVVGAAHTGSVSVGREDRWSDIDLALCLDPAANMDEIVADWTGSLYRNHAAVAHCDVMRETTLYRVFLLENTLQVDISFWRTSDFRATGPAFKLVFGTANPPRFTPAARPEELIGMGWLYALHVRSSIARSRPLQAEYMLSGMRNNVLALACVRFGLPSHQGRGVDELPGDVRDTTSRCFPRSLETSELKRAFRATLDALHDEICHVDADLGAGLEDPLRVMGNCLEEPYCP